MEDYVFETTDTYGTIHVRHDGSVVYEPFDDPWPDED